MYNKYMSPGTVLASIPCPTLASISHPTFEYAMIDIEKPQIQLNAAGKEGWELVCTVHYQGTGAAFLLKRQSGWTVPTPPAIALQPSSLQGNGVLQVMIEDGNALRDKWRDEREAVNAYAFGATA